ncbi:MAG: dihydrofolate reductase [Bacteroidia bacterium]|nr:dihydrofolate reductase [Bacteroidia bacterium]
MKPPLRILIAAMDHNHVIGAGDRMPWHVPEEYEHYRSLIASNTVIMGRTSFEIFGADLTSDHTIVMSRSMPAAEGHVVASSLSEALALADKFGKTIFIAGGASIYEQALPLADEMLLSEIKGSFEGDAFFPQFDRKQWRVEAEIDYPRFIFRRWVKSNT